MKTRYETPKYSSDVLNKIILSINSGIFAQNDFDVVQVTLIDIENALDLNPDLRSDEFINDIKQMLRDKLIKLAARTGRTITYKSSEDVLKGAQVKALASRKLGTEVSTVYPIANVMHKVETPEDRVNCFGES